MGIESATFSSYVRGKEAPRAFLFYIFLLALLYAPVVFSGKTLVPGNYYPHGVVESGPYEYDGRSANHTLSIDLATPAYFEFPINKLVGDQYKSLTLPLWNPYQGAGTPLAAQYSSKVFFPYQILENISPVSLWDFFLLGRLLFAGIVTFLFLRAISLSFSASFLGGLFYMFSGSFVWFINLEQMVNVAMVAPLLLLSMEALARRGRLVDIAVSAVTFALVLLAGQPETALYVLFLGALYYILRLVFLSKDISWKPGKALRRFVLSFVIGFFLAAPVIIPFVELWANAHHIHPAGGNMGVKDTNSVDMAINILTPTFFIRPLNPDYSRHPLAKSTDSFGKPLYSKLFPNNGQWDHQGGYSGVMMLFLSLAGVIAATLRGPRDKKILIWFFFAFALSIVLKNFGVVPFLWLGRLPFFDQVWSQRWAGPVWTLGFAISGALGFEIIKDFLRSSGESSAEAPSTGTLIASYDKNKKAIWAVVVHAVLSWVSFLYALAVFSRLVLAFTGEPLSTLRLFAIKTFFMPTFVIFLIAYIYAHRKSGSETARLTLRGYAFVLGISALLVNLLVLMIAALGVVETSDDVYIGGIEVHAVIVLSFVILTLLLMTWMWMSKYTETRHQLYKAIGFSSGFIFLFYLYVLASIPEYVYYLSGQEYYFSSIFLGEIVTIGALLAALLCSIYFIRSSKGVYALIGLSILELWFAVPRAYDPVSINYKLIPLAIGLVAVIFMALKWWRAFAVLGVAMLVAFLWIDKEADYGFPERYDPFTPAPYVEFLKSQDGFYRSMGSYGVLFPNYASSVGIHDVRFINSLAIGAFQDFRIKYLHIKEALRETSSALWFTGRPELYVVSSKEKIDLGHIGAETDLRERLKYYSMLSVRYFITPKDEEGELDINMEGFPLIYDKEVKIYENRAALARAYVVRDLIKAGDREEALEMIGSKGFDPETSAVIEEDLPGLMRDGSGGGLKTASAARVTSYGYDRLEVEATLDTPGLLVLTDAWYPGWTAYVDGVKSPIYRVNSVLRGVALGSGTHSVIFKYSPSSFKLASLLFAISLLSVVVLILKDRDRGVTKM